MIDGPCKYCDRSDCPLLDTSAYWITGKNAYNGATTYTLDAVERAERERDCAEHAVDWRAEALRLRPVRESIAKYFEAHAERQDNTSITKMMLLTMAVHVREHFDEK